MWSQKILKIARIGTARSAPAIPHIQPQKMRPRKITTGLSNNRRPTTAGVTKFP